MKMTRRRAQWALLALLVAGCSGDKVTEIVVGIATNLTVPKELDELDFRVDREGQQKVSKTYLLDPVQPGYMELPGTVSLVADDRPEIAILVTVTGKHKGKVVVIRQASLAFVKDKSLLLKMDLLRSCAHRATPCKSGQTCTEQGCVALEVDPNSLPEYDRDRAFASPEAGKITPDHGIDAGPPDKQIPDKPMADKQIADKPVADKPVADKPIADKPIADKPIADKPVLTPDVPAPDKPPAIPDQPLPPDTGLPGFCATATPLTLINGAVSVNGEVKSSATTSHVNLPVIAGCTDLSTPGAETFYAVNLTAGETYRVTLDPASSYNAGFYVFTDCLQIGNSCVAGADKALSGNVERVSFTPATSGIHYIGVDSRYAPTASYSHGTFTLTVTRKGVMDKTGIHVSNTIFEATRPRVAFDGTKNLVVWNTTGAAIQGAFVSSAGAVLSTTDITISPSKHTNCYAPALAYGAGSYLVLWPYYPTSTSGFGYVYGARVSPTGTVLDPSAKGLTSVQNISASSITLDVAFGAPHFLLTHPNRVSYYPDVMGQLVNASVGVQQGNIKFSSSYVPRFSASVARDDKGGYLVVWKDYRTSPTAIYGTRVSSAGQVLDSSGIAIGKSPSSSAGDAGPADAGPADAGVTDADLGPPDAVPGGDTGSPASGLQQSPHVTFGDGVYLVVWEDKRSGNLDIYGARVSTTGAVMDNNGFAVSAAAGDQQQPRVAFGKPGFMVVWSDNRTGNYDIRGVGVNSSGKLLSGGEVLISSASGDQAYPDITFTKSSYMIVWQDKRASTPAVYGARANP